VLAASGAAIVRDQALFTPEWLAEELRRVLNDPAVLLVRAAAARQDGRPDAAERLADLVLAVAEGQH
jgi:UDP-N-acetylglucosamine--N-acetylmuramyl-(pentapeptide) pyrophosphoryl-undecaprenol N-acetylglucosamine transferase